MGLFLFSPDACALQIKRVVRGRVDFTADDIVKIEYLGATPFDLSKTFVIITNSSAEDDARQACFTAEFDDSQNLLIQRSLDGATATVEYMVVEFVSGVTVQRASTAMSSTSANKTITIGSASLSNSFVLLDVRTSTKSLTQADERWTTTARLTAPDQLYLEREETGAVLGMVYQVITFSSDVNVQYGSATVPSSSYSNTSTVSSVDTSKAVLFFTRRASTDAAGVEARYAVEGNLTNATTLTFARTDSPSSLVNISWFLVNFTDTSGVPFSQRGRINLGSAATGNATLSAVNLNRTFAVISVAGGATQPAGTFLDDIKLRANLTTSTNLRVDREGGTSTTNVSWFVVELPPLSLTSPDGDEDWRVGDLKNITWEHADSLNSGGSGPGGAHNGSLYVSTNNGTSWILLSNDSDNDGVADTNATGINLSTNIYGWRIPEEISGTNLFSDQVKINITDIDEATSRDFDFSNKTFQLKGNITVQAPNGAETWGLGENKSINWTRRGNFSSSPFRIRISDDNGSTWNNITWF